MTHVVWTEIGVVGGHYEKEESTRPVIGLICDGEGEVEDEILYMTPAAAKALQLDLGLAVDAVTESLPPASEN